MLSQLESILSAQGLLELLPRFAAENISDEVLPHLTDADLLAIGVDKLGNRKLLLAAFASLGRGQAPVAGDPAAARRDRPFVNSLGLPFVPIPGIRTLACVWQVRVRDFRAYCTEAGIGYPECDFVQGDDHPAVNVTWHEAVAFSEWLTHREHHTGFLGTGFVYRLPEDREWSAMVGLAHEPGKTPSERSGRTGGYPWGAVFPPPRGGGNYHSSLGTDDFPATSPVGSFLPNACGIHDLGGNVWEWCLDDFDESRDRKVLRGASCFNDDSEYLLSSHRDKNPPGNRRNNNGLRLVLKRAVEKELWF